MADDIRFHERLLRLSDWIDGDPNVDEDLWSIPKQALAEIKRLRAAGDAVVDALVNLSVGGLPEDMNAFISALDAWEAARRG